MSIMDNYDREMNGIKGNRLRFLLVYFAITLVFLVFIVRLICLQLFDCYDLYPSHIYKTKTVSISGNRGLIIDRNGKILADNKYSYKFDIFPVSIYQKSVTIDQTYKTIAKIFSNHTSLSYKHYLQRINKYKEICKNGFQLAVNIDVSSKNQIEKELKEQKTQGISSSIYKYHRIYSQNGLLAQVIGMVDSLHNGISGIEKSRNQFLCGKDGWKTVITSGDGGEYTIPEMQCEQPKQGNRVQLTIDSQLQEILRQTLTDRLKTYNAKNAIGIIMSAKTGEIFAMSNISRKYLNSSNLYLHSLANNAIAFTFEPGSTFKPFVALLALENNLYQPKDKIDGRPRTIEYESFTRPIKDSHYHTYLTFTQVITLSSNVGISRIADDVGMTCLYSRLKNLGFGSKTGIELSGEQIGIFRKLENWSEYSLHSIAFGQEISVTPIQLINAFATLANNGELLQPHIIKGIESVDNELIYESKKEVIRKISNERALNTLKSILAGVVENGTAKRANIEYVTIGGKTGTAEKANHKTGGYYKDKYVSTFIGFFPVENPEFIVLTLFDEPCDDYHLASNCAVPSFRKVIEEMMLFPNYALMIGEDNYSIHKTIDLPNFIGKKLAFASQFLKKQGIKYNANAGQGIVVEQYPKPNELIFIDMTVHLIVEDKATKDEVQNIKNNNQRIMPKLVGLSLRKALQLSQNAGVTLKIQGNGIIISQSIKAGTILKKSQVCKVLAN